MVRRTKLLPMKPAPPVTRMQRAKENSSGQQACGLLGGKHNHYKAIRADSPPKWNRVFSTQRLNKMISRSANVYLLINTEAADHFPLLFAMHPRVCRISPGSCYPQMGFLPDGRMAFASVSLDSFVRASAEMPLFQPPRKTCC